MASSPVPSPRAVMPCAMPSQMNSSAGPFGVVLTGRHVVTVVPVTVALSQIVTQFGTRWNDLMAVSTVVALPIVLFFVFLQRYIVGGLTAGSLKE